MAEPQFIHLRTRSAYSLLDGAMTVGRIAEIASARALPALGLCDNNMFGALEFSDALSYKGIQPIVGLDVKISDKLHDDDRQTVLGKITLLAQSEAGFSNLMALSSATFLEAEDLDNALPLAKIAEYSQGLICLSGGFEGAILRGFAQKQDGPTTRLIETLASQFNNRFYLEIQRHGRSDEATTEAQIIDAAYRLGLPLVATNDIRYEKREQHGSHEILTCIAQGAQLSDDMREVLTQEHYFKPIEEMTALFSDLPECLDNSVEIAKRCAVKAEKRKPILPSFASAEGLTEADEIARQAHLGLKERLEKRAPVAPIDEYEKRLDFEIQVITKMGFSGYFLVVSDFIKWAKDQNIPVGPGRGSGAGSLVAYALNITDLDPLEFGLLFERFLNPDRISMPDFDIDFCQDRRDEVISYVQRKYGFDRVAQIITFGTLQARAAVRDVGRVLGLSFGKVTDITKLIPNNPANPVSLSRALEEEDRLKDKYREDEDVKNVIDAALELEGLYRNASTHAAGLVIAGMPIKELVPLYKDPRSELPATQYNMKWAEAAGLVKFDFLGLKTLTIIQKAIELLKLRGIDVDFSSQRYDDPEVFEHLATGFSLGVFQLEGQGMRDTLRRMVPTCLEDIIALISLYRPGPMDNIPTYCDVKAGKAKADYLHPSLEPVLRETHGVIIYQEQVMQIAQILSGYSLGEADVLRRAMGKKLQSEMDLQRIGFVKGASEKGISGKTAGRIFDLVNKFAGYGFNKSHAAAYAVISYQTAWLKTKYPVEFLVAAMCLDIDDTAKLGAYVQEARRLGIKILKPSINSSQALFSSENGAIVYGLSAIKSVGRRAMEEVVKIRETGGKFENIHEFFERVGPRHLNKRSVETLAKAGAFDEIEPNRARIFAAAEQLMAHAIATNNHEHSNQISLFGETATPPRAPISQTQPWGEQERLSNEFSALGLFLSGHPLDDMYEELVQRQTVFFGQIAEHMKTSNAVFRMAGIVRSSKERAAKRGGKFAWVTLSDPTGEFDVFIRPDDLDSARPHLKIGEAISFMANAKLVDGDLKINGSRFDAALNLAIRTYKGAKLFLTSDIDFVRFANTAELLKGREAEIFGELRLVYPLDDGREVEFLLPGRFPLDIPARRALKTIVGVAAIKEY
jgi:DNA polymerase-3 subunit alpha